MDRERVVKLRDTKEQATRRTAKATRVSESDPTIIEFRSGGTVGVLSIRGGSHTVGQLVDVTTSALAENPDRPVLITRIGDAEIAALSADFDNIEADSLAGAARIGPTPVPSNGSIAVLCSARDLQVAAEAAFSASAFGLTALTVTDADVAHLPNLIANRPVLATVDCLICVGRGAALASTVATLLSAPVIAVPIDDLQGDLSGYPQGVPVVASDDGFGAAACAWRIARVAHREPASHIGSHVA